MRTFALRTLVDLDSAACASDARIAFDARDPGIIFVRSNEGTMYRLPVLCGTREMRLLGRQLVALADYYDREGPEFDEIEERLEDHLPPLPIGISSNPPAPRKRP